MDQPKLPIRIDSVPPELLCKIFSYLRLPDLLRCRLVNRHFNEIVGLHAERITYYIDLGIHPTGKDYTTLATLAQTEFPFKNFRVPDASKVKPRMLAGVSTQKLKEMFSRASTLILCGLVRPNSIIIEMVGAARKSVQSLSLNSWHYYRESIVGSTPVFAVTPYGGPLSFPGLKELCIGAAWWSVAELEAMLKTAPGLRILSFPGGRNVRLSRTNGNGREAPLTAGRVIQLVNEWCPHLESLNLSGLPDNSGLATICDAKRLLSRLKEIVLDSVDISDSFVVREILEASDALEVFRISNSSLRNDPLSTATSRSIVDLRLDECGGITIDGLCTVINGNPRMKSLSLRGVVRKNLDFISLCSLRHLTHFEAKCWDMSEEKWMAGIQQLGLQCGKSLVSLNLSDNYNVTDCVVRLAIANFPRLHTLNLSKCSHLTDHAFIGLDRPEGDQEWPCGGDLEKRYPALTDLPNLIDLNLEFTEISDRTLEFGLNHPSLEVLDIHFCTVSARGLLKLSENAPNLRRLRMTRSSPTTVDNIRDFVQQAKRLSWIEFEWEIDLSVDREHKHWIFKHLPSA